MSAASSAPPPQPVQVLLVGPYAVGMTSIVRRWVLGYYEFDREPIWQTYSGCADPQHMFVDLQGEFGQSVAEVNCIETMGGEDNAAWRRIAFDTTHPDVVVGIFRVDRPNSAACLKQMLIELQKRYLVGQELFLGPPLILCGNQIDCRDGVTTENAGTIMSFRDGVRLANELNAVSYIETSAANGSGIDLLFREAALAVLKNNSADRSKRCALM